MTTTDKIRAILKQAHQIELVANSLTIDKSDATLSELLNSHEALRTSLSMILTHLNEQETALQRILSITLKNMELSE